MGPLAAVLLFKYLRRVMITSYDDWMVVVSNLRKARRKWDRMFRTLIW